MRPKLENFLLGDVICLFFMLPSSSSTFATKDDDDNCDDDDDNDDDFDFDDEGIKIFHGNAISASSFSALNRPLNAVWQKASP